MRLILILHTVFIMISRRTLLKQSLIGNMEAVLISRTIINTRLPLLLLIMIRLFPSRILLNQ